MLTKIITWLLDRKQLSLKDKNHLMTHLTKNIGITAIDAVIGYDDSGSLTIRGKTLSPEQVILFKQGLSLLQDNWARKVIREQMKYDALMIGVLASDTEKILFAKALNWLLMKEEELVQTLDK